MENQTTENIHFNSKATSVDALKGNIANTGMISTLFFYQFKLTLEIYLSFQTGA